MRLVLKTFPILLYCKVTSRLKVSDYFSSISGNIWAWGNLHFFPELINANILQRRKKKTFFGVALYQK